MNENMDNIFITFTVPAITIIILWFIWCFIGWIDPFNIWNLGEDFWMLIRITYVIFVFFVGFILFVEELKQPKKKAAKK